MEGVPRVACSEVCRDALVRMDRAVQLIIQKSEQGARAGAYTCYSLGGLFLLLAGLAWIMFPVLFVIVFLALSGVGLLISGRWYAVGASRPGE